MSTISDEDVETTMQLLLAKVEKVVESRGYGKVQEIQRADGELEILETSVKNLETRMQQHIAAQRRQRNELLPVHRLPPELLARIFFLALQTHYLQSQTESYFIRLGYLSAVSWRWNALARSPNLHGILSSEVSPSTLSRCLSNSKDSALDIFYYGSRKPFEEVVLEHVNRWRSLELNRCSNDFVRCVMDSPTPQLNDLRISNHDAEPIIIPSEKLRRLRHLALKDTAIQWEWVGMPLIDLWTFEFEYSFPYKAVTLPSTSQIFAALEASPRITTLVLDSPSFESTADANPGFIHLQNLEHLTLSLPGQVVHRILTRIRIPNCTQLHIVTRHGLHDILDDCTTHLKAQIGTILASTPHVTIEVSKSKVLFTVPTRKSTSLAFSTAPLKINIEAEKPESLLRWFNEVMETLQPPLPVHLRLLTPDTTKILPILGTTCSVTELTVVGGARPSDYIKFLSLTKTSNGITRWRLPNLKTLVFEDCDPEPDKLIRMIRSRYGPPEGDEGNAAPKQKGKKKKKKVLGAQRPVPLDMLGITGSNDLSYDEFELLEEIVGAGNVEWDDPDEEDEEDYDDIYGEDYDDDDLEYF